MINDFYFIYIKPLILFCNRAWTKELKNAKEVGKKPKLAKVLAKLFWKKLLLQTCFYCFDAWVIA
jgi:hypothetical protein